MPEVRKNSKIGITLKQKFPVLYRFLVRISAILKTPFVNKGVFITDSLGGSYKIYISRNNLDKLKYELYKNLDEISIEQLEIIIDRIVKHPDYSAFVKSNRKYKFINNKAKLTPLLPLETLAEKKSIERALVKFNAKLHGGFPEASVLYFFHGLTLVPYKVLDYIKEKVFIDIGAYIGDSAIAFSKYHFSKIFSFDISRRSMKLYHSNMFLNGISQSKYELIHAAVGMQSGAIMEFSDTGSPGLSTERENGSGDVISVTSISIDDFCSQRGIEPKLIKADMEGHAMEFVKGALNTIKKNRPVLLIAIYHNPVEFFEIKPFLQDQLNNYSYLIRKISPTIERNECHSEVFMIAYPAELN